MKKQELRGVIAAVLDPINDFFYGQKKQADGTFKTVKFPGIIPSPLVLLGKKIGFNMNPSLPIFYESLAGGNFQPGDLITDQTTGNTAIVVSDAGGSGNMVIRNIGGLLGKGNTFNNGGGVSAQFDDDYNIVTEEIPLIAGNKVIADIQILNGNTIITTANGIAFVKDQVPTSNNDVTYQSAGSNLAIFSAPNKLFSMGNLKLRQGSGTGTINTLMISSSLWAYLTSAEEQDATCDIYVYGYVYP